MFFFSKIKINFFVYKGDIAFRFLNYLESSNHSQDISDKLKYQNDGSQSNSNGDSNSEFKITICDINENMLNVGKERSRNLAFANKIDWKVGNAEDLKNEKDETYDVYTIAFGIRNCTNLDKVVKEAYRVLKPGGRFLCLEFSKVDNEILKQ